MAVLVREKGFQMCSAHSSRDKELYNWDRKERIMRIEKEMLGSRQQLSIKWRADNLVGVESVAPDGRS